MEDRERVCKNDDQILYTLTHNPKSSMLNDQTSICRELLKQANSLIFLVLEEEEEEEEEEGTLDKLE